MSKRTGRIATHINNLREHPDDVIENDELIFLRHGFKNPAVGELRRKEDYRVLCQMSHEGLLVRDFNGKGISCFGWEDIFTITTNHPLYSGKWGFYVERDGSIVVFPGFYMERDGCTFRLWKKGSEEKSPLVITI